LLQKGSPLEERGTDQWTALHLACVSGSARAVAVLAGAGADANSVARSGNTPLHLTVTSRSREAAEALLRAGADPTVRDDQERTAADLARSRGLTELARVLEGIVGSAG
jgi:ankyrin repeat protein